MRWISAAAAAILSASSLTAGTLEVPTPKFLTIQRAIDLAQDGDTVLVKPGEYLLAAPLDFNRLTPNGGPVKNITVRSERGRATTILRLRSLIRGSENVEG